MGHVISAEGIALDENRVESIQKFKQPSNKKDLMQFLGLVNYVGRFISDKTNILEPLNELLKEGVPFHWDIYQERAFNKIKEKIQNAPVLSHYDPTNKIIISADSSSYGLGAVLLQENREVVSFASRTLNNSEKNYAQIEKECLALTWAVHKFRDYVVGINITMETDHKPLLQILQTKPLDDLSPRLLRFRLQLMRYFYNIIYVPGKKLVIADALSRSPLPCTETSLEGHINVIQERGFTDQKLKRIKEEQEKCNICNSLVKYTKEGWPHRKDIPIALQDYYQFRYNFSIHDDFLLYNTRLVIPVTLQKLILEDIHQGHLGVSKCRERAKQAVWWLGLSSQIKILVQNCPECIQERNNFKKPMVLENIPKRAWEKIAIDLFKNNNVWYIVLIDYYSRYLELFCLNQLTEEAVIKKCKETFARFGIPEVVRTDAGPQFKSKLKEFSKSYNFEHVISSPYFAQSNGCAEAGVKIAKMLLKKNSDINLALLIYRNTPGETGFCPNELMFNRRVRDILPMHPDQFKVRSEIQNQFVPKRSEFRKNVAKQFDKRHNTVKLADLHVGDSVWVIDLRKYGVISRKAKEPRSYFVKIEGVIYRRNRWHLIPAPFMNKEEQNVTEVLPTDFSNHVVSDNIDRKEDGDSTDKDKVSETVEVESEDSTENSQRLAERRVRQRRRPSYLNDYVCNFNSKERGCCSGAH